MREGHPGFSLAKVCANRTTIVVAIQVWNVGSRCRGPSGVVWVTDPDLSGSLRWSGADQIPVIKDGRIVERGLAGHSMINRDGPQLGAPSKGRGIPGFLKDLPHQFLVISDWWLCGLLGYK